MRHATGVPAVERIDSLGVRPLPEHFDTDHGIGWSREQLAERIGNYDGIEIRSATRLERTGLRRAVRCRCNKP